jgi:all-trans-retinol 13,14-reductase
MVGGVNCAGEILGRPLLVEMIMGAALVEDGDIPADPPGFDPMEWSRGRRLRERRAADRASRRAERAGRPTNGVSADVRIGSDELRA